MLKGILVVAAIILVVGFGLHFWFVHNARTVLMQMVATESKGKLRLDLSELRFELLSNKIQVRQADLLSTDSLTQATTYQVKFRKLTLRVASFWPLLFEKKLLLDSIKLHDPEITVMQWRIDTTSKKKQDDLSVSQEMGKLYNSMLDGLETFGIRRIMINNGTVSLLNKMKPGTPPVTISNIYFNLVRTAGRGKRDEFVANQQTVDLETTDQDIGLPGGRHRIAFKNFKLELFRKRIQMDSCTITAIPTDSSKSSYQVFFRQLLLVGVDFDAMYRYNLIRADSVYCENPLFNVNINTRGSRPGPKKERPDPDKIIRELTGDLELAFVGVKDAGIHINISGKKDRSLFNSNKDDFEMRGLRINGDSSRPVVVERFDMLVRDYHLYNEDSSSAYSFDSIHFLNNKIVLNNFTMTSNAAVQRGARKDFKIPYFELTGMDWYALIFDQNLVAREATLRNPVIAFATTPSKKKKTRLFASLHTLDNFITLQKLNIYNGKVQMRLGTSTSVDLQQLNLSLNSNELLRSGNPDGLRQAVEMFSFSNGTITVKDLTASLVHARYTGSNLLRADLLRLRSRDNKISADIKGVAIDNMLLDDAAERIVLDGLHWNTANISIAAGTAGKGKKAPGSMLLKNMKGGPTVFQYRNEKTSISTFLESISLRSLTKSGTAAPRLDGLQATGRNLRFHAAGTGITADRYAINSNNISTITGFAFAQVKGKDSTYIRSPHISFGADLNELLSKDMHLSSLTINEPEINITKWQNATHAAKAPAPSIRIDQFLATKPAIRLRVHRNDSVSLLQLPVSGNGRIAANGVTVNASGIRLDRLVATASNATFLKTGGEVMGVEKGKIDIDVSNIRFGSKDGKPEWSALVNTMVLQNPNSMVFGKKRSRLVTERLSLGNLNLSSGSVTDMGKLMRFNVTAWLETATGQLIDSSVSLKWYNASYNAQTKLLSLDSFSYAPTRNLDTVLAAAPYQLDYITFRSGAIRLSDFNLEQYKKDSSILGNTLQVTNPLITIYRDKAPPFKAGKMKPLPVDMIKSIPLPVTLQHVQLIDGELRYTERNAKTRMEGTMVLKRMRARLSNISNRNFNAKDSLQLNLTAWLMDSAELNLSVKESYTDTLSGFLMTLRMKPTGLSFLNPVLAPLSNVSITSGVIDSLHVRAIGSDEVAVGAMNMYYHDLRIKLVKKGDKDRSGILGNVATFLANTFVIRKNNDGRTGFVYYERDKTRSFFNYLIRMTFSGMAASVGAKKNKRYEKKYQKLIREKGLPELVFE